MSEQGLKTEQPTEKRLREAFAEGQFAKTPDIQLVFLLVAALAALLFTVREQTARIAGIAVGVFGGLGKYAIKPEGIGDWARVSGWTLLGLALPIGLACAAAAALAGALQSGFRLTPKVLEIKLSRLNPAQGFQRIFSGQGWARLGIDALKLALLGAILYSAVKQVLSDPIFYTPVAPDRLGGFIRDTVVALLGRFILALGGIAALNYFVQRRKVHADLMMTKQEVKEEHRSAEGDPMVRAARRQMARRLLQKQMLSAVPTADVVVTNPTHFAVALKYERGRDSAPMVLAKGERLFALRIKAIAARHEVPTVENKPVARMLFKYGRVGKPIPIQLYKTVAEILAFVYRTHRYYFHELKRRRAE
jgi:flagellar biosynthesis protein FlhB